MAPCDSGTTHVAFGTHDGLGLHNVVISWLNPIPHAITVYASDPALPRRPQHSLPGGSLRLTRTGLAPVGSRQLRLAHRGADPRTAVQEMVLLALVNDAPRPASDVSEKFTNDDPRLGLEKIDH
jgi:hypothetical protein